MGEEEFQARFRKQKLTGSEDSFSFIFPFRILVEADYCHVSLFSVKRKWDRETIGDENTNNIHHMPEVETSSTKKDFFGINKTHSIFKCKRQENQHCIS
ncbi:hypothetical protein TNIN_273741 [Trichonephila inaurata madagascariensis]|uniref:Uncharacterized protein n=1 Tax=Trichonephila inaurata madagascariensis TaxID=2747483 RepID=A0A8X6YSY8_9ARAC|nr:hypothetical protein TNIN_273741 [Trichonephila inaurata madagascariensis]